MTTEPSVGLKFFIAGLSNCVGVFVTNPLDVVKVRLQNDGLKGEKKYNGVVSCGKSVIANEGLSGFFAGVGPSMIRESVYSTLRFGLYEPVRDAYLSTYRSVIPGAEQHGRAPLSVAFLSGATTGIIGSMVASPADLIKIRLQMALAQGQKDATMGSTFMSVYRNEGGVRALWKGVGANMQRSAMLTGCQMGFYDKVKGLTKQYLLPLFPNGGVTKSGKEHPVLFLASAFSASFFAAVICNPVDVVRTRLMSKGGEQFKGTLDCGAHIVKEFGVKGLYKGFVPNWLRLAPRNMVTFMTYELLRSFIGLKPL